MTWTCIVRRMPLALLVAFAGATLAPPLTAQEPAQRPAPQAPAPAPPPTPAEPGSPPADSQLPPLPPNDIRTDPAQPDFTLLALPTNLRVPNHKTAFRVTHRFARPLGQGDFGSLLEDFFGLDSGALIGLELRFGLLPGVQVGIHRTSNRTIELFNQYSLLSQSDERPISLDALVTVEGRNNFREDYSPALGLLLSRKLGRMGALYLEPIWVGNTNPLPDELADDNHTFVIGVGARVRIRPTVHLVGELAPRVAGFDPGVHHASFGIEKRVGGHSFQLNFSNAFGTTLGQIARGGLSNDDWYIGFNISRKFF